MSCSWYGYGARYGPKIATRNRKRTTMRPSIASRFFRSLPKASRHRPVAGFGRATVPRRVSVAIVELLAVADARVDVGVQHIDHQVEERHDEGVQDGHRHQHAVVMLADRGDVVATDAGDAEDRLDDERTGHEECECRTEDRHHRDQRVADHVS